ncbi:MAG: hypothetical protein H6718_10880 [Polyangiaceae bacterium]|nr:hypothetical protein [Myxococcales bacterium]MCB9585892.1 hypothetical protein [Polyangiaceae bacterium]MCB9607178.1 hypothetical protein [Polyangiaceae bacterium]
MNEVSCKTLQLCFAAAEHFDRPVAQLVEGLDIDPKSIDQRGARMSWSSFAALCERLNTSLGGHQALLELGEVALLDPEVARLRAVAGYFGSARAVYWAACSWYGPSLFRNLKFSYEEQDERELIVRLEIPEGDEDCQAFFHLVAGALRVLPDYLGQPHAEVTADLSPRKANFRVLVPPPLTLGSRLKRWSKALVGGKTAVEELALQEDLLRDREVELAKSERNLFTTLDALPHGIIIHYAGEVHYANKWFWESLGGLGSKTGLQLLDLVHPDDLARATRLIARAPESAGPSSAEVRCLMPDGGECVFELVVGQPVSLQNKEYALLVAREVSSQRRLQTRLAQMDRLASLGTLAAGVAHEINNPVTYVLGNLYMAERALKSDSHSREDLGKLLATASEGVERISEIVSDLKTFARPDERELGGVDVARVLQSVVGLARTDIKRKAQLILHLEPVPPVVASRARLAQLFLNLLVNAVQALPEREPRASRITITTRVAGPWVSIEISDNGVGIDPESRERVFEPFYTTKPAGVGTGLGLSICHGIVESLEGRIVVESDVGIGTTFRVLLPHGDDSLQVQTQPPKSSAQSIAVVADDDVVEVIKSALEDYAVFGRTLAALEPSAAQLWVVDLTRSVPEIAQLELAKIASAGRPVLLLVDAESKPVAELNKSSAEKLYKPFRFRELRALVARQLHGTEGLS